MKIGILGTGSVAQALAGGCIDVGHEVTLGSRQPESRTGLPFPVATLEATARDAEVIVNATPGAASVELLGQLDSAAFSGKLLIDVANAATSGFNHLYPGSSLGEKLQEMLPQAQVVKTMNTCAGKIFVNPSLLEPSSIFLSGDNVGAKDRTTSLLGGTGLDLGIHRGPGRDRDRQGAGALLHHVGVSHGRAGHHGPQHAGRSLTNEVARVVDRSLHFGTGPLPACTRSRTVAPGR